MKINNGGEVSAVSSDASEQGSGSEATITENAATDKQQDTTAKVEATRAMGMAPMGMHPMPMHPAMAAVMNAARAGTRAGHGRMANPMGVPMGMPMGVNLDGRAGHGRDLLNQQGQMNAGAFGGHLGNFGAPMQANAHATRDTAAAHELAAYNDGHAMAALRNAREEFAKMANAGQPQTRALENQAPIQGQGYGIPLGFGMPQHHARGIGHQMPAFG